MEKQVAFLPFKTCYLKDERREKKPSNVSSLCAWAGEPPYLNKSKIFKVQPPEVEQCTTKRWCSVGIQSLNISGPLPRI